MRGRFRDGPRTIISRYYARMHVEGLGSEATTFHLRYIPVVPYAVPHAEPYMVPLSYEVYTIYGTTFICGTVYGNSRYHIRYHIRYHSPHDIYTYRERERERERGLTLLKRWSFLASSRSSSASVRYVASDKFLGLSCRLLSWSGAMELRSRE